MKKLAIACAAAAAIVLAAAPFSQADAQNKKAWEGWWEDVQKLHQIIMDKAKKK